ncbi:hypothetical protein BC835DRAFT_1416287 [Cytidiella melzeri]|nr:hypothetical protein BC835DRAFT_1416287 [Cytidiella melzeri]
MSLTTAERLSCSSPVFSLDDFQRLLSDAFTLSKPPPSLPGPSTSQTLLSRERSYFDDDDDDDGGISQRLMAKDHRSIVDAETESSQPMATTRRRSSASCVATMEFSAPSPSPSSLIRRRRHASLSCPPNSPPPSPPTHPPPTHSRSFTIEPLTGMPDSAVAACPSQQESHVNASPKSGAGSRRFLRALKTRASNILMRSSYSSNRTRTETSFAQPDSTTDPTDLLSAQALVPLVEEYTFPPRSTIVLNHFDDAFLSSSSAAPRSNTSNPQPSCPSVFPLPGADKSPHHNIKPGRYATSPKAHSHTRTKSSVDAALTRSLLHMGLSQRQPQDRKRTSSVPLNVLCLTSDFKGGQRAADANRPSQLPTPPRSPKDARFAFPHVENRQLRDTSCESTEDPSTTPLRLPLLPESLERPLPPLPVKHSPKLVHDRGESCTELHPDTHPTSKRPVLTLSAKAGQCPLPRAAPKAPLSAPLVRPSTRIHTHLPPLKTAKSLHFQRSHNPSSPNLRTRRNSLSNQLSKPIPSGELTNCSDATVKSSGIVSLGLGLEFWEGELDESCPDPYINPRPAPTPPTANNFGESGDEEGELEVPGYVFERRGSATSNCTMSSTQSTRTLKERLSAIVPASFSHMPSLKSLKSRTRSKLNLTVSVAAPSLQGANMPSASTSSSPSAALTKSTNSSGTDRSGSTNGWGSFPSTPLTPGIYHMPSISPSSLSSSSVILSNPLNSSDIGIGYGEYYARSFESQSELSLELGMGSDWESRSALELGPGSTEESEEEARAIGRVLTPEHDPFKRMDMPVPFPKIESTRSADSMVNENFVFGGDCQAIKTEMKEVMGHGHTSSGDTITPFNSELLVPSRLWSEQGEKYQEHRYSARHTSSSNYTFPRKLPSPLALSTRGSALSLAIPEAGCPLPDSPISPLSPAISSAPALLPISPVSSFSPPLGLDS